MGTIDGLKAAADVLRAADKIPEYQKILDAMATITDLQTQLSESQQRVRLLEKELEAIRTDQQNSEGIRRDRDLYVVKGYKYCPGCWEMDKRLAPVVSLRNKNGGGHILQCCRCHQEFSSIRNQ